MDCVIPVGHLSKYIYTVDRLPDRLYCTVYAFAGWVGGWVGEKTAGILERFRARRELSAAELYVVFVYFS